ncbi:hypothetical protein X975_08380, partial [Stegodyphus mimosarum]
SKRIISKSSNNVCGTMESILYSFQKYACNK